MLVDPSWNPASGAARASDKSQQKLTPSTSPVRCEVLTGRHDLDWITTAADVVNKASVSPKRVRWHDLLFICNTL